MRTDAHEAAPESLTSKSFRAPPAYGDQTQLEISGFGVRGGTPPPQTLSSRRVVKVRVPLGHGC